MAELDGIAVRTEQLQALALTNYGHFTSMRVDEGAVRGLSLHMDRLMHDCRRVFDTDLDPDRVRHLVRQALADAPRSVIARVTVFDPELELGRPGNDARPRVLVTTRTTHTQPAPPLRACTAVYVREMPDVKHVGLFGTLRLRRDAQRAGFDDVVFTDPQGNISEGATWNIGFVAGERVIWPKADCLPGITMTLLNHATATAPLQEAINTATVGELDAAFITNAAVGIRPVASVDDVTWSSDHPMLHTLSKAYHDLPTEPL